MKLGGHTRLDEKTQYIYEMMEKMKQLQEIMQKQGISDNPLKAMTDNIGLVAEVAFAPIGLKNMDFSLGSLKALEMRLNEHYPVGHKPIWTTLLFNGVYLGETIRRNSEGIEWDYANKSKDPYDIALDVKGPPKGRFFPFRRLDKFWKDRSNSLYFYAEHIIKTSKGELDIHSLKPDMWNVVPGGGGALRPKTMPLDDLDKNGYKK